jgi:hypothetical protein
MFKSAEAQAYISQEQRLASIREKTPAEKQPAAANAA